MMSVGERRGVVPVKKTGPALGQRAKPSRLQALQADLQSKILKEKEEKLMRRVERESNAQEKTLNRLRDHDSLSAPGGVRSFFKERKTLMTMPHSAGQLSGYKPKKKEGYDKSRPLEPINRNTQNLTGLPSRTLSDSTLINSSKQVQAKPTDFQKWRVEQDMADKQRRLNSLNKKNGIQNSPGYQTRLDEYEQEAAELRHLQEQEEIQRRALAVQRKEEEKERKALLKQKQEQKRLDQAEKGRRRKEESERRQKELATELQHQKEAEQVELDEQAEMLRQLEEQLKEKQKDLKEIEKRKPRDSPDYKSPEPQYTSRRDHPASRNAGGDTKPSWNSGVDHPASRNSRVDHPASRNTQHEDDEYTPPTKPKKVNRKVVKPRLHNQDRDATSQPTQAKNSPHKSNPKSQPHELNSTYNVVRENSIPIAPRTPEPHDPFVVDGEGLDMNLSQCAVCGRNFAEDRIAKHQKACKKSNKPRKQFDSTAHRIAGSGAEKLQYKQKQAQNDKSQKKDWRLKREEFISAIRYAKKAAAIEAKGGNVADLLPPPPKAENPDYVQCPHCSRKFNQGVAERHIPKCKDIRAKPTMLKKGSRR